MSVCLTEGIYQDYGKLLEDQNWTWETKTVEDLIPQGTAHSQ